MSRAEGREGAQTVDSILSKIARLCPKVESGWDSIRIVSKLYQNCIKFIGNRAVVRQERGGEVRLGETRDNYRFPLDI